MDRLKTLLAKIPLFSDHTRAFLLERASSMDAASLEDFIASLASYAEEKEQLLTEYREHQRLLDEELRAEISRLSGSMLTFEKQLTKFAQSLEEDPEQLIV